MSETKYSKHTFTDGEVLYAKPLNEMDEQIEALTSEKQDTLVFNTAYDASDNKAATMKDISNAIDAKIATKY